MRLHDWFKSWWRCPTCVQVATIARWYHIQEDNEPSSDKTLT